MTEETAKGLTEAMNRLAAAIESIRGGTLSPGINVHHHGLPQAGIGSGGPNYWPPFAGGRGNLTSP